MRKSSLLFAVLGALFVSACAARGVRVAELKDHPSKYDDKTVSVTGTVTSRFQLYKVDDGTGEITVVSREGRSPSKGTRVRVKGKVGDVATFGGQSIGLHLQESDRDYRDR
jgi:hypothetical protein